MKLEQAARLGRGRGTEGGGQVETLTAADVVAFLLSESARVSVGATKGRVAELRSLLRFLHLKGLTPTALASAVPPVAGWHDTGIPIGLTAADVQRLLDCCDRSSTGGIRDFAILMIVARLGLRSAEVARLELDDIDWRGGEIVERGQGPTPRPPSPANRRRPGARRVSTRCAPSHILASGVPGAQGPYAGHPPGPGQ